LYPATGIGVEVGPVIETCRSERALRYRPNCGGGGGGGGGGIKVRFVTHMNHHTFVTHTNQLILFMDN